MKTKTTHILSLSLAVLLLLILLAACQSTGADTPASGDNSAAADAPPSPISQPRIRWCYIFRRHGIENAESNCALYRALRRGSGDSHRRRWCGRIYRTCSRRFSGWAQARCTVLDELIYMDVAKAALNYNFLDLSEILAGDDEFSEDDYLAGVFDACRFGGRQYTIPLSFFSPLFSRQSQNWRNWDLTGKASKNIGLLGRDIPSGRHMQNKVPALRR